MKHTITVLQDDIDNGVRAIAWECPVARALCRDLADLLDGRLVQAADDQLWLNELHTPPVVAEFMYRFDRGLPVKPFKFEIEVPQ